MIMDITGHAAMILQKIIVTIVSFGRREEIVRKTIIIRKNFYRICQDPSAHCRQKDGSNS